MDIRQSVIAEGCGVDGELDLGSLVQRLLLFDRIVVKSSRLAEVPRMVEKFGLDPVLRLLASGAVELDCNGFGIGESAPTGSTALSYSFVTFRPTQQEQLTGGYLRELEHLSIGQHKAKKLANAVERQLLKLPPTFGKEALEALRADLPGNLPGVRKVVLAEVSAVAGMTVRAADLKLRIFYGEPGNSECFVESNLAQLGFDPLVARAAVGRGLLAVAEVNRRFEEMKLRRAVVGFRDEELPVLNDKLRFAMGSLAPDEQERRLARVLRIADFPDFRVEAEAGRVDLGTVLEIRETGSCVEFRQWLRNLSDAVPDKEIADRVGSFRSQLANIAQSLPGKILRFAVTTAAGVVPVVGAFAGPAASALDTFLLDRVLSQTGPVVFLDKHLPSIFRSAPL